MEDNMFMKIIEYRNNENIKKIRFLIFVTKRNRQKKSCFVWRKHNQRICCIIYPE